MFDVFNKLIYVGLFVIAAIVIYNLVTAGYNEAVHTGTELATEKLNIIRKL